MTNKTYKEIVKQARLCHKNVTTKHKTGMWSWWSYYFAKALINPKKDVQTITIANTDSTGDYFSQLIGRGKYLSCAKYLIEYVEKHHKMPKNIPYNGKKINNRLFTFLMAKGLMAYDENKAYKSSLNLNSKVFTAPTETGNVVYDYYVKKTGKKPKTIDEVLGYMQGKGYGNYSDDKLSNKQVIDGLVNKSDALDANCTDALQMLINMGKAMGYDCKCIHVQCRTSGTGHVFGKFRHKVHTENTWITRDPASVLNGNGIRSVWCENGYLLATDPSWFLENLNR